MKYQILLLWLLPLALSIGCGQFLGEQEELKLGETDAVKLSYTANLTDALGNPVELANTQYLMLDGSTAYVITLTIPRKLAEDYLQPSVEAVETFRLQ